MTQPGGLEQLEGFEGGAGRAAAEEHGDGGLAGSGCSQAVDGEAEGSGGDVDDGGWFGGEREQGLQRRHATSFGYNNAKHQRDARM
jgi:hypothetical protein